MLDGREAEAAKAADLLWRAAEGLDFGGRVLAAANSELPVSSEPLTRLWQAATLLREHRGDGHFAALAAAGIDGCEAVVLRCAKDMSRDLIQPARGWTDEQWAAAAARLAERGWLGEDGTLTAAGRAGHDAVEAATDQAAERPGTGWARSAWPRSPTCCCRSPRPVPPCFPRRHRSELRRPPAPDAAR